MSDLTCRTSIDAQRKPSRGILPTSDRSCIETDRHNIAVENRNSRQRPRELGASQTMLTKLPSWIKLVVSADKLVKQTICGSLSIRSTQKSLHLALPSEDLEWIGEPQSESQTSITFRPAEWLSALGIRTGFSLNFTTSSLRGWKHTLDSFRAVPDDSPIYESCRDGNLPAVLDLLSSGCASVRDTNSRCMTPLHVGVIKVECLLGLTDIVSRSLPSIIAQKYVSYS